MTQTPIPANILARVTQAARYVISGVAPDGWFGPMQPIPPMAPAEVAGRRFDYPTGYNLNYNPRAYEPVTFEELRALADSCDILRSVIETRKDQMEAMDWLVRVAPSATSSRLTAPTDDQKRRIDLVTDFLHSPDREHSFQQWLRQILEDMFVIDGVALYRRRNNAGGLYALEVMDAATIRLLLDDSGRTPVSPDPAYQQILKGVPAADYTRDELMYIKHNPRSHKVYGYSHVEQVLVTVNILIRRALHQLEYYRDGSQPDAFIGLPKEWNQEQIVAFQKHFDAMLSGNLGMRRRLRFMPGEFKYQETKAPPLKDVYDEFLARIICFVFSVSPEPFVSHVNRATAESSQSRAIEEGLAPLMRFVRGLMNRIIKTELGSPDLEFAWQDVREQDPAEAAQIDVAYVQAGIMTPDEIRANMGLLPLGGKGNAITSVVKKNFKMGIALAKDDDENDAEEGDSSEEGDDSSDESDSNDESDFDSKHPRWPAGSDDGKGGEFAPKNDGDTPTNGTEAQNPSDYDTSLETWGNPDTLQRHFDEHGADFNAESPQDYANQANEFFKAAQENGLQVKVEPDGYTRIYDPQTNTFGSYNPDGTTRTFYSPPEGQAYFDRQSGALISGEQTPNVRNETNAPPAVIEEEPLLIEEPILPIE